MRCTFPVVSSQFPGPPFPAGNCQLTSFYRIQGVRSMRSHRLQFGRVRPYLAGRKSRPPRVCENKQRPGQKLRREGSHRGHRGTPRRAQVGRPERETFRPSLFPTFLPSFLWVLCGQNPLSLALERAVENKPAVVVWQPQAKPGDGSVSSFIGQASQGYC